MPSASRIKKRFDELRQKGAKAFIPYIMCGDPTLEKTEELVRILEDAGADAIELGVPFSDPLADGPVIQAAAARALAAGVNLRAAIGFVGKIRRQTRLPLILMTYYNPVFRYGEESFSEDAAHAGVDGVIVPDLPVEEASTLIKSARRHALDTIFLAAPTSGDDRLRKVARASRGFVYFVSITGITGARLELSPGLSASVSKLREFSGGGPVAVGFGVSTPGEAAAVAGLADGVIIGSAIVKKASDGTAGELSDYLKKLRAAIR
ncbi:MAG: tryptophan synthase subunit alpha [Nitrospiraceae bacterium]|nr:tryptophan synthase subunit alpha [Nitrospiraceae bacterium]